MNRREFCKTLAVGAAGLALPDWLLAAVQSQPSTKPASTATSPAGKPNIILILTDDVGLDVVSCYGSDKYKTPQIDDLAKGGTRFEYCFATPLCGPSRAQLLTGRYPFRTGMTSNNTGGVMKPANETMIPKVLKSAGYVTASVGKWAQMPFQPSDWGFDEYLRFQASGKYWDAPYTVNGQEKELPKDKYLPDVMHEFLVDFITRHKDQPFFVYYPMSHMHTKLLPTPDSPPDSKNLYADNMAYMDKLVGKLVAELDRLKLRERTLVIFTGDNGTAEGAAKAGTVEGKTITGKKHAMQEGGSRVPLIVNWPGAAPAGAVCKDLTDFSDFFPTLAELADAKPPDKVTIDGRSFAPQIKGQKGKPREWVYVELEGERYVRISRWKLTGEGEFFDMKEAPFKEIPVAADTTDAQAVAGRKHLQEVLGNLTGKAASQAAPTRSTTRPGPGGRKKALAQ